MYHQQLVESKHLTEERINQLLEEFQKKSSNKQEIKTEIFNAFVRLVYKEAKRFKDSNFQNISFEDLIQEGVVGLLEAIDNYKIGKGDFRSYVAKYIKGYIMNATNHRVKTTQLVKYSLEDKVESCDSDSTSARTFSEVVSNISSEASTKSIEVRSDLNYFFDICKKELTEKERDIIFKFYFDRMTLVKIGNLYDYTAANVNIIIGKAVAKIKEAFSDEFEYVKTY